MPASVVMDFIENLGRPIAAVGAVICCFILYRLAVGYYAIRHTPYRRGQHAWTHVGYAPLTDAETFADDEDGYGDGETNMSASGIPSSRLNSPLPDKPLPPLPYDDEEDDENDHNDGV
jgi:hypothetical protein